MTKEDAVGRLDFTFSGVIDVSLSPDPTEFKGLKVPAITKELMTLLRSINPNASFVTDEVELAAQQIHASLTGAYVPTED